jgi:hypothetical protein
MKTGSLSNTALKSWEKSWRNRNESRKGFRRSNPRLSP